MPGPPSTLNWDYRAPNPLIVVDDQNSPFSLVLRPPYVMLHTVTQGVLSTHMGSTYPNHKGNYYYRNHTLYHIGTLALWVTSPGATSGAEHYVSFAALYNEEL